MSQVGYLKTIAEFFETTMLPVDLQARFAKTATLLASAARTESGNTFGTPEDSSRMKEALFFLDVTAVSGTGPTLDVAIKTRDPVSKKWFTIATFTQFTAVGKEMIKVSDGLGERIAVEWTIGGTSPSFTFSVGAVMKA